MEFTPDGRFLVVGASSALHLFQVDPWSQCGKIAAHTGSVWAVAMDPKGPYMATGGGDGLTCLWDRESLVCSRVFGAKDTPNMSLAFSHDGKYLAIGSNEDTNIEIRSTADGAGRRRCARWGYTAGTGTVAQQLYSAKPIDSAKWNPKHFMLAFTGDYVRDRQGETNLWCAGS